MLEELRARARALKAETYALFLAARDPRTPWYARALIAFVVAHTLSPIDLIPDFIPVLGYLDDLVITPGGIALAVNLIPPEVLDEARARVREGIGPSQKKIGWFGAAIVVLVWVVLLIWAYRLYLAWAK